MKLGGAFKKAGKSSLKSASGSKLGSKFRNLRFPGSRNKRLGEGITDDPDSFRPKRLSRESSNIVLASTYKMTAEERQLFNTTLKDFPTDFKTWKEMPKPDDLVFREIKDPILNPPSLPKLNKSSRSIRVIDNKDGSKSLVPNNTPIASMESRYAGVFSPQEYYTLSKGLMFKGTLEKLMSHTLSNKLILDVISKYLMDPSGKSLKNKSAGANESKGKEEVVAQNLFLSKIYKSIGDSVEGLKNSILAPLNSISGFLGHMNWFEVAFLVVLGISKFIEPISDAISGARTWMADKFNSLELWNTNFWDSITDWWDKVNPLSDNKLLKKEEIDSKEGKLVKLKYKDGSFKIRNKSTGVEKTYDKNNKLISRTDRLSGESVEYDDKQRVTKFTKDGLEVDSKSSKKKDWLGGDRYTLDKIDTPEGFKSTESYVDKSGKSVTSKIQYYRYKDLLNANTGIYKVNPTTNELELVPGTASTIAKSKNYGLLSKIDDSFASINTNIARGTFFKKAFSQYNFNVDENELTNSAKEFYKNQSAAPVSYEDAGGDYNPNSLESNFTSAAYSNLSSAKFAGSYYNGREVANNNPGNIRVSDIDWLGEVESTNGFTAFSNMGYGFAAMFKNLKSYVTQGYNTVSSIINRWAPSSENDTSQYLRTVMRESGFGKDDIINPMDKEQMMKLALAMFYAEEGQRPVQSDVDSGWNLYAGLASTASGTDNRSYFQGVSTAGAFTYGNTVSSSGYYYKKGNNYIAVNDPLSLSSSKDIYRLVNGKYVKVGGSGMSSMNADTEFIANSRGSYDRFRPSATSSTSVSNPSPSIKYDIESFEAEKLSKKNKDKNKDKNRDKSSSPTAVNSTTVSPTIVNLPPPSESIQFNMDPLNGITQSNQL